MLTFRLEDGVAFLTLDRPQQFNALSSALIDALHNKLDHIEQDSSIQVLVIAANGKAFCAGHDLREMQASGNPAAVGALFDRCSAFMLRLTNLQLPVVAEVNGMATAAGCQLVAQCDLAIAADTAKFAVSGINLGLFCATPAVPLSRTISRKRALEMLFTGEFIDATTAKDWGLVNKVVPAADLHAATLALCETLKAKPRASLALGKALFYRQINADLANAYADASQVIACNFFAPAAQEGINAFLEKRAPRWPNEA